MTYEVLFRGESETKLHAWKPADSDLFGVEANNEGHDIAEQRYNELVAAGLEGREVDGVVPYLVTVQRIEFRTFRGDEYRHAETMLFQYAEPDAYVSGQWAEIPRVKNAA